MKSSVTFFVLVAATLAAAQRGAGFHFSPAPAAHFRGGGASYAGRGFTPLLYGDLYYDSLFDAGYPVASQPPVIFLQSPPPPERTRDVAALPKDPLLIELQGDRYVRLSGDDNGGVETIDRSAAVSVDRTPDRLQTAVILIFRDGHREEISTYAIANGVIYANGNYSLGSANRNIQVSSLDLPATIEANRLRNVPFQMPAAPNEVIIR